MGIILFFEDNDIFAEKTKSRLSKKVAPSINIKLAKPFLSKRKGDNTYIQGLHGELSKIKESIDLIVADVNLYDIEFYKGLSAEVVSEVGKQLFIPVCVYSRIVSTDVEKYQVPSEMIIRLNQAPESTKMIDEIIYIHKGFTNIKNLYNRLKKNEKNMALPRILATILKRTQYLDRLALYSQGMQDFMRFTPIKLKRISQQIRSRTVPYLLGNWLLLSIMKFPGVLVNEIAAASYLNIAPDDFKKSKVNKVFNKALYQGPFSELENYWWRYELDEIIEKNNFNNGLEFVRKRVSKNIKPCKCTINSDFDAGYYCIVDKIPVSFKNSTREVSWIPKGADLARVNINVYNKLKPWMGIF